MHDLHSLVARQLGRPVLMTPDAAETLAARIYNAEPRAFRSETKFAAFLRLAGRGRPQALDAADIEAEPMPRGGMAYVPLWMEDAGGPDGELGFGMSLKQGIACLNIDTAISARGSEFCGSWYHGYDTIAAALRQAFADDRVRGIFIRFETPGGVVDDGIDEVSEILRGNREAAGGKPVWGFCDVAASAGYWIASQCDRLIASRTGIVGSIGAVMIHTEYSGMLAKDGIRVTPIQFGAQKTAGNMFQELSETAAADMQAWVDQAGRDFVAAITLGRPALDEQTCLATEARIYTGHHDDPARSALGLGLVDELMREAAAFEALRQHTEQAVPETPAAASAGAQPASTATTGDPNMAKRQAAAATGRKTAKLAAKRKVAEARLAAIRAEEEEAALEEDEEEGAAAEGEEDEVAAEGEEAEAAAEGEEDEVDAEDEEEDDVPAARPKGKRAAAILALPEAQGAAAPMARALARKGFTVPQARTALRAAKRAGALATRQDTPLRGGSATASSEEAISTRLKAAIDGIKAKHTARPGRR
ncbi:MAG: S49 family peptidase [Hyphomonas sp.]|nr:S49 family peptidase [Hyphomonas sp.]